MARALTLADLRRMAIRRTLFPQTTLPRAIERLGFVQADPIRAPARAQDLVLRHRVRGYRAGDLERRYPSLEVEEDFFINYGFLPRALQRLMHPRTTPRRRALGTSVRGRAILDFVRARGDVHPREVQDHFSHGTVTNYWGGSSNATTHLLDAMQYHGLLGVVRRDAGIRRYRALDAPPAPASIADRDARLDALIDLVVRLYAPLPASSLVTTVSRLRFGVPQWRRGLKAALGRVRQRLKHERVEGVEWYWPDDTPVPRQNAPETVRLLAPFDPLVWDRRRFEIFWGWAYRFEAYTPVEKRKLGYYALPLLWGDRVVGWGNLSAAGGVFRADFGYVDANVARDPRFKQGLDSELAGVREFLGMTSGRVRTG